jgi:hypothetical protein
MTDSESSHISKSVLPEAVIRDSIGLIGTPNSGKTIFILSISEQTDRLTGRWRFGFSYPEAIAYVQSLRHSREHGSTEKVEHKTLMLFPAQTLASSIGVHIPVFGRRFFTRYQVSVPDVAGEYITRVAACQNHSELSPASLQMDESETQYVIDYIDYLSRCGGLLCCIDPAGWDQDHGTTSASEAFASLNACQVTIGHILKRRRGAAPLPVSVMLTKADGLSSAGKGVVRLPDNGCLLLEYLREHGLPHSWVSHADGWVEFDVITALRQPIRDLEYAERLAWDFLYCHNPKFANRLRSWNEDKRLSARPYLMSSTGTALSRDGRKWLLPAPGSLDPIRTSDAICSVLNRLNSYRSKCRVLRSLAALAILVIVAMVIGPWSVNISTALSSYLVSKGHLAPASRILSLVQLHPIIDIDRSLAPQRLAGLSDANKVLSEQLRRDEPDGENMPSVLAAANRAVALAPDPGTRSEWRDGLLVEALTRTHKDARTDRGILLIKQSRGLLRPTEEVLTVIDLVLTTESQKLRKTAESLLGASRSATPKTNDTIIRLEEFSNDLRTGDLFLRDYRGNTPPTSRMFARARSMGDKLSASCQSTRAIIDLAVVPADDRLVEPLAAPGKPLGLIRSARKIAIESADPIAIYDVEEAALRVGLWMLDQSGLDADTIGSPDASRNINSLLAHFPALSTEIESRASRRARELRLLARFDLTRVGSGLDGQWSVAQEHALDTISHLRGTDPRESLAIKALLALASMAHQLEGEPGPRAAEELKGTLRLIEEQKLLSEPLSLAAEPEIWHVSDELRQQIAGIARTVELRLEEAISTREGTRIALWGQIARSLGDTSALSEEQHAFQQSGPVAAAIVVACLDPGWELNQSRLLMRDLFARLFDIPASGSALQFMRVAATRASAIDGDVTLQRAFAFRSAVTSQTSLDAGWAEHIPLIIKDFDDLLRRRLVGESSAPLGDDVIHLLEATVLEGDGSLSSDGRGRSIERWLRFALAPASSDSIKSLTYTFAEAYAPLCVDSDVRNEPFRELIDNLAAASGDGSARNIAIPQEAIEAATILGADRARAALEALARIHQLAIDANMVYIPSGSFYIGRTEVTVGWCRRLSKDTPNLRVDFDPNRLKLLVAQSKRSEDELFAFDLSFLQATALAKASGARLPTSTEWRQLTKGLPRCEGSGWQGAVDGVGVERAGDSTNTTEGVNLHDAVLGLRIGLREWGVDSANHEVLLGGSFLSQEPNRGVPAKNSSAPDIGFRLIVDAIPQEVAEFTKGGR